MGDIKKMFFQVRIPKEHRNYLRFLWYPDNNLDSEPEEYRITVHLFGAVSSPSIANFVLKSTAGTHRTMEHSWEARNTIARNFYVDDLLKSTSSSREAISLLSSVTKIISEAGFLLTGFTSNSQTVLESVSPDHLSREVKLLDLEVGSLQQERALGVTWDTGRDAIGYNMKALENIETKRGVLSTVFSVYDPLGLAGPFILPAKAIFQATCQSNLQWDDELPPDLLNRGRRWLQVVPSLADFAVQRCLQEKSSCQNIQMHVFCDGSEISYAAVAYLRFSYSEGDVGSHIVMTKSRLVPLKRKPTIPRIELSGAKLAVVLGQLLMQELQFKIDGTFYWTDSTTVLKYLKNETRRFQRFVSNRVTYIRNFTQLDQWKHVPGVINPADLACRGTIKVQDLNSRSWKHGPNFLTGPLNEWPLQPDSGIEDELDSTDPELVKEKVILSIKLTTESPTDVLLEASSSWLKIKIRVAWWLRLRDLLLKKSDSTFQPLTVQELEYSETSIWSYIQRKEFPSLTGKMSGKKGKQLMDTATLKRSGLLKLHPCLVDGLLRVGGRLSRAEIPEEAKHPIILPSNYHVVKVLVRDIHAKVGHLGKERILCELRKKYWVIGAGRLVRKIIKECILCRKIEGRPGVQLMADLPQERLQGDTPPFTNIGLDAFGPFLVTRGRGRVREKRWGIVFTCLVSRAIHLEILYTLDTSSFIDSLRRFVARRGVPRVIRSDNGTNFVGANKELRESIQNWNRSSAKEWMLQENIDWRFNPPAASHFGGSWEREIRSIRKVMNGLLNLQPIKMDDEGLNTLFCEVEAILNGRPLTSNSSDPSDFEALTPNHLLLGRYGPSYPPGLFSPDDKYSRRRWRQIQYLADIFWRRWRAEYLPLLQVRQKWHSSDPPMQEGDLVLITDNLLPRNQWSMGRVSRIFPDKQGDVRFVDVKVPKLGGSVVSSGSTSEIRRPIAKLIFLDHTSDQ